MDIWYILLYHYYRQLDMNNLRMVGDCPRTRILRTCFLCYYCRHSSRNKTLSDCRRLDFPLRSENLFPLMNCDPGHAYQDEVKIKELGVSADDIAAHDVVSRQVVEQMVNGPW